MQIVDKWEKYWSSEPSKTSSLIALIGVNLFPVFGVFYWGWEIFPVMLLYWSENVIVGFYNVLRMVFCQPKEKLSWLSKLFTIPFFMIHYGGFTAGHGVFVVMLFGQDLLEGASGPKLDILLGFIRDHRLIYAVLALFISHGYSFFRNYLGGGEYRKTDLTALMMQPYRRVVLLHITLVVGGILMTAFPAPVAGLLLFIILKTGMDLLAHRKEHLGKREDRRRRYPIR